MHHYSLTSPRSTPTRHALRLGFLLAATFSLLTASAEDFFLKIDKIDGESRDPVHAKEIDVMSYSWGGSIVATTHTGGGGGAGKASFQDLSFTMNYNKASTPLWAAMAKGTHIDKAILTVRRIGKANFEYLKYTMEDVLVTSISEGGSSGSERPTQTISLNFGKFKVEYRPVDERGNLGTAIPVAWDVAQNAQAAVQPGTGAGSGAALSSAESTSIEKLFGASAQTSKPRELSINGQRYLSIEVTGTASGAVVRAETSENLRQWFGEGVIEEVATEADGTSTIRYSIPMDKAQQFLRLSAPK